MGNTCGLYDHEDEDEDDVGESESHERASCTAVKSSVQAPFAPSPNWTPGAPAPPNAVATKEGQEDERRPGSFPPVSDSDGFAPSWVPPVGPYVAPVLPDTVDTIEGVEKLDPEDVYKHMLDGTCVLVDVRDKDRAAGLIEGAVHVPVVDPLAPFSSKIPWMLQQFAKQSLVVFTCQYCAHRGPFCANYYRERTDVRQRVAILVGGFRAWEGKGLPVHKTDSSGFGRLQSANEHAAVQGQIFAQQHAKQYMANNGSLPAQYPLAQYSPTHYVPAQYPSPMR